MYLHLTIKLLVGFVVLFIVTKFIGGRELRQLNVFDFISAIVLSELVGNVLYQEEVNAIQMSYAILFWTGLIYLIDKITLKFHNTRKLLDGESELVIEEGIIDRKVLSQHRLELSELLGMLREKDIFSIREVRFAFIEPDGNVSVVKGEKIQYGSGDLGSLPAPLIMDGKLVKKSLTRLEKNEDWLRHELLKKSIHDFQEVFYAEYLTGYGLLVQTQQKP
ncbi:DUF421 domain-containing protein [Paenibacillus nanensis]|uniref:DUF421 domain-containing protein n=1 Tax=Paenibacillus nanensis TaxID=393251 RepID=A0A3A1VL63_9BACL|nr:DUF421 domain-containing protein [Paenibacillus nanensis]RIX59253.1 DUF421 domain-containing protein [Paenibacillus nanensis]